MKSVVDMLAPELALHAWVLRHVGDALLARAAASAARAARSTGIGHFRYFASMTASPINLSCRFTRAWARGCGHRLVSSPEIFVY